MPVRTVSARLRHACVGVMVAWCCVLLTGMLAPLAQVRLSHAHVVHLCSGEAAPADAPNPMEAAQHPAEALVHHSIDCPLCLPVLAPGSCGLSQVVQPLPAAAPLPQAVAMYPAASRVLPPARGPPATTS